MKYKNQIEINVPKDFAASYIRRSEYFDQWQDDFQSATLLSGSMNEAGTMTQLLYKFGKSDMELTETIMINNLPDSFKALYEHKHMNNTMRSTFESIGETKTLYITEVDYIEFKGFMIKIMSKLFAGKFKKGPEKWMRQYKSFVESEWKNQRS